MFEKGHETVGVVAAIGKNVKSFEVGMRVVADNSVRISAGLLRNGCSSS